MATKQATGQIDGVSGQLTTNGDRTVLVEDWVLKPGINADLDPLTENSGAIGGTSDGNLPALTALTFGTNITAATANGALADSTATNPTENDFNELAKELGTRCNDLGAAVRELASKVNTLLGRNIGWEVQGTNMTTALATFADGGGITLTTAGADADQAILTPHLNTSQGTFAAAKWNTLDRIVFDATIKTGSSIANAKIWAGFKLTNTPVVATDNDQAFFRYEDDVASGALQCIVSNGGTDTTTTIGTDKVTIAASTEYRLQIAVDADRVPTFYVNGVPVLIGTALASNVDLKVFIGVMADGAAAAKAITIRPNLVLAKDHND